MQRRLGCHVGKLYRPGRSVKRLTRSSTRHPLPQWILDFVVCNFGGAYIGMKISRWLEMREYRWRSIRNISSVTYVYHPSRNAVQRRAAQGCRDGCLPTPALLTAVDQWACQANSGTVYAIQLDAVPLAVAA